MKKVILILTVFGCFIAGNANAGIAGYAFSWNTISADVVIKGTGKTSDGDTVTISGAVTDVEYVCGNPGTNKYVVDGTPGRFEVNELQPINDFTAIQKNGKTTVSLEIKVEDAVVIDDVTGLPTTLYETLGCVNENWEVLKGSAAPKQLNLFITWSDCSGERNGPETCGDTDPGYVLKDQVYVECRLDPILRYGEGTTLAIDVDGKPDTGEDDWEPSGNTGDFSLLPIQGQEYYCDLLTPPEV
jgi:hypothetical protein